MAGRSGPVLGVVVLLLLLTACGSAASGPRAIPADALPGVAGEAIRLDAAAVAIDAEDAAELETLLADAGFVAGAERSFGQVDGGRKRALARVLVFDQVDGARRYAVWLEDHLDEVIGGAEPLGPLRLPGARFLVVNEPDACCPRETPVYLAAWGSGTTVVTLEVGGVGVEPADVKALASQLDAAI
ncbi:MAG: hypothetical protein WD965_08560 [Actinomycetota bacterium]